MTFRRILFHGMEALAARLAGQLGHIAFIEGSLYECVSVGWKRGWEKDSVTGDVVFSLAIDRIGRQTFPRGLLEELLVSSTKGPAESTAACFLLAAKVKALP